MFYLKICSQNYRADKRKGVSAYMTWGEWRLVPAVRRKVFLNSSGRKKDSFFRKKKKNARAAFAERLRACDSELQFDVRLFLASPTRGLRRATLRAKLQVTTKLRCELRFKLRLSERLS